MTRYWKDGFYRTNAQGNTHWVEGHIVERLDWTRSGSGGGSRQYFFDALIRWRADRSISACFVNPNAECPVCGAAVFFYQNSAGSRVYFDELGPPWPKHPCTAIRPTNSRCDETETLQPLYRELEFVDGLLSCAEQAGLEPENKFAEQYGVKFRRPWSVQGRFRANGKTLLILVAAQNAGKRFISAGKVPRALKAGSVVFLKDKHLMYFDLETMEPRQFEVQRIKGANGFVDCLLAGH